MLINGLGNVTEVNSKYIFLNDDGRQDRIPATEERINLILVVAREDIKFYERMMYEIHTAYEKKKAYVEKQYHYISDEELEEVRVSQGRDAYFAMYLRKDSNNEEYHREFNKIFGFFEGFNYALDRKDEAYKISKQAEESLKRF